MIKCVRNFHRKIENLIGFEGIKLKQPEYFRRIVIFILISIVIAAQMAFFGEVWYSYYRPQIASPFWYRGNVALIGLYGVIFYLFSRTFGGLKIGYMKKSDVIYTLILSVICTNVVVYLQITLINRWFLNAMPLVITGAAGIAVGIVWVFLSNAIYYKLYPPKKMLIIYGEYKPDDFIEKLAKRSDKYAVNGVMNVSLGEKEIKKSIRDYEAVIIWDLPAQIRNEYLKYCFSHSIRCYVTPKISDIIIQGAERIHLFDTPLLLSRNIGMTAEQAFIKRLIDIVISLLGIIITSPVMLLIALVIKAYDRGPVFYHQERTTIGGQAFMIHKFRSMMIDSEQDGAMLASKNDSRITPVGKILRNTHLDELPQLFNILKGDMAVVGPRPERKEFIREYTKTIPEFPYRLRVKAGLTGYAQVFGKYNTTPYDKLKLDLFYIENYSLLLDAELMLMTFRILFQKETSEGVEDGQRTALIQPTPQEQEREGSNE